MARVRQVPAPTTATSTASGIAIRRNGGTVTVFFTASASVEGTAVGGTHVYSTLPDGWRPAYPLSLPLSDSSGICGRMSVGIDGQIGFIVERSARKTIGAYGAVTFVVK